MLYGNVQIYDLQELHEACGRGELDCQEPESNDDIHDTEMSPTVDEEEDEECESDSQCSVSLLFTKELINTLNPEISVFTYSLNAIYCHFSSSLARFWILRFEDAYSSTHEVL